MTAKADVVKSGKLGEENNLSAYSLMSSVSSSNISLLDTSSASISSLKLNPSDNEVGIWLIEDHEIYSRSLQRVIDQTPGMRCTGKYPSAEQAFADLEAGRVSDLVLLDVQLPGMDGITALSGLKSMLPGVPVLILTVFDDEDKISRAVSAGASGYVLKSSSMSEITERIMKVIHGADHRGCLKNVSPDLSGLRVHISRP